MIRPARFASVMIGFGLLVSGCAPEQAHQQWVPEVARRYSGVWKLASENADLPKGAPPCITTVEVALEAGQPWGTDEATGTITWCGVPYAVHLTNITANLAANVNLSEPKLYCLMVVPVQSPHADPLLGTWAVSVTQGRTDGEQLYVMFDPDPSQSNWQFGYTSTLTYLRLQ